MNSPGLWHRLRSARLWRVLLVYAGASWAILETTDFFIERFGLPDWFVPGTVLLLLIGLVVLVATALVQTRPTKGAELSGPTPWEFELADLKKSVTSGQLPRLIWARATLVTGVRAVGGWRRAAGAVERRRRPRGGCGGERGGRCGGADPRGVALLGPGERTARLPGRG